MPSHHCLVAARDAIVASASELAPSLTSPSHSAGQRRAPASAD